MNLRDIFNPWGALREARADVALMEDMLTRLGLSQASASMEMSRRGKVLRDIAAMETPRANATVKRMAARAREGMK